MIEFFAAGVPRAQPRPRAFARRVGLRFTARVYDDGTADAWKQVLALAARGHVPPTPMEGPVKVDVTLLFPRPRALMRRNDPDGLVPHAVKPDRDNLDKPILDCLTALGFWRDDAQVCAGSVSKFYTARGGTPGARIRIESLLT